MPDDEHFQCDGDTKCPKAPTHAHPGWRALAQLDH